MVVGRKPKPTAAKLLHGTFRADRAAGTEPKPKGTPTRPRWLSGPARTCWNRVVPQLIALGIATNVDTDVLVAFCQARADFEEAVRTIKADGQTVRDRFGQERAHPAVGIQAKAVQQLRLIGAEFGLTASGRVRLAVAVDEDDDDPGGLLD